MYSPKERSILCLKYLSVTVPLTLCSMGDSTDQKQKSLRGGHTKSLFFIGESPTKIGKVKNLNVRGKQTTAGRKIGLMLKSYLVN